MEKQTYLQGKMEELQQQKVTCLDLMQGKC